MKAFKICADSKCMGCYACYNACPRDAILMMENKFGSITPKINEKKCISCNACIKVCPINTVQKKCNSDYAYAVWSKDKKDIIQSSSGGAASVFSKKILRIGGSVFGAACVEGDIKHIKISKESDIDKLRGSKYVQSQIGNIYQLVKKELASDRWVLFIGTPCQIAALLNYLGKNYEKLVTVDLICHGTPPAKYLKEHINKVLRKKNTWDNVTFRGKKDFNLTVLNNDQVLYQRNANEDTYFLAFLEGLIFRESCYSCQYACPDRVSDITIGDFWGLDKGKLKNFYEGKVSLVLLNSDKGKNIFFGCQEYFVWERRDFTEALNLQQRNLLYPSIKHEDREVFLSNYVHFGFEKSIKKTKIGKIIRNEQIKRKIEKYNLMIFYRIIKRFSKLIKIFKIRH